MVQNKKEEVLDILKSRFDVLKILIKRANLFYDSLDKGELFQYQVDKEEIAELKPCIEWLENLQEQPQIAYGKHEFCKSMNCPYLTPATTCDICGCFYTAKQFHQWLQCHNFKIIKENADEQRTAN